MIIGRIPKARGFGKWQMVRPIMEDQRRGHKFPACLYRATGAENRLSQALPSSRIIPSSGYLLDLLFVPPYGR